MKCVRLPRSGLIACIAVVLAGCGFDTGGVASSGASIGSVGDETEADDAPEDDGPSSAPEGDGGDAPATSAATDDDPSAPTTDPTGDPTGDPTTEAGGSSGVIDPTTGASVDPTTGMDDPTTSGDEAPPPPDPAYPTCSGPNTCADASQDCLEFIDGDQNVVANLCVPECILDADCPPPDTGTAMPYCSDFSFYCRLSCDGGLTCPNGMTCYPLTNGSNRCAYML